MLIQTTFLGDDVAFRTGRTVNAGISIAKLSVRFQKTVAITVYAVLLATMFVMIKQGVPLCVNVGKGTLEGIPFLSYVWAAASIPVGFSPMFVTAIKRLYDLMMSSDITVIPKT